MSPDKQTLDALRIDRAAAPRASPRATPIAGAVVALALLAGAAFWLKRPAPALVRTAAAEAVAPAGGATLLNATGYVTARREATVSSKVTGKVLEVLVEEGMRVEADQVLARLDASNVERSLQVAQAQLASARSALDETTVNMEQAERHQQRLARLADSRATSEADRDQADAIARALKARLERQRADVTVAESDVALWQQQVEDTVIRAPFAGVVTSKNAQPGEMISPMSSGGFTRTGICTLVDMASLEIEVDVNESYINRVAPGQPVEATLDAYPDGRIPAKVIAIIPTADRQKATVKVRVGFEQLDPRVLPDMGVKVAFRRADAAPADAGATVVVPRSAVRQADGHDVVWLVREGRVERRAVTVGDARGESVVLAAGVAAGERVVIEGPENLADGGRIKEAKP